MGLCGNEGDLAGKLVDMYSISKNRQVKMGVWTRRGSMYVAPSVDQALGPLSTAEQEGLMGECALDQCMEKPLNRDQVFWHTTQVTPPVASLRNCPSKAGSVGGRGGRTVGGEAGSAESGEIGRGGWERGYFGGCIE